MEEESIQYLITFFMDKDEEPRKIVLEEELPKIRLIELPRIKLEPLNKERKIKLEFKDKEEDKNPS